MKTSTRLWLFPVIALLLGVEIGLSMQNTLFAQYLGAHPVAVATPDADIRNADLSVMKAAWQTLLDRYIAPEKLDTKTLTMGAAEGLVRAVGDPYTVFMTPVDTKEFRDTLSGTLEGIGAQLEERDKLVVVVVPLKGSPAEKAGLMPDDIILEVNGERVDGLTLNQVVSKVRGPKGTQVTLTLYRAKTPQPIRLTITRAAIELPSVDSKLLEGEGGAVAYVDLTQFGDRSIQEIRTALEAFKGKTMKGFVLDLRGNGGGYLEGAIDLVSMFLKEGKVVSVVRRGEPIEERFVTGNTLFPDVPMVVLVDAGSASASEITAGALQDNGRAKVIGVKSYGKGTVQEILELPQGATIKVTVAKWLTPKGKDLSKDGIHPDFVVERSVEQIQKKEDPQLDAALTFLRTGKTPTVVSSTSK